MTIQNGICCLFLLVSISVRLFAADKSIAEPKTIVEMNQFLDGLEKSFPGNGQVQGMQSRLDLLTILNNESNLLIEHACKRLTANKRTDLLVLAILELERFGGKDKGGGKKDFIQIKIVQGLCELKDKRAIPYCLYLLKLKDVVAGRANATTRSFLIGQIIHALWLMCDFSYQSVMAPSNQLLSILFKAQYRWQTIQDSEKFLRSHPEYAEPIKKCDERYQIPKVKYMPFFIAL